MRSYKGVVSLGLAIIFCIYLAACGGSGSSKPMPLILTKASLPSGFLNTPYDASLTTTGGTLPYTYSITSGSLPAGLTLTPANGLIAGTPTAFGVFPFMAQVTDGQNLTSSAGFSITIQGTVVVTTSSLPGGLVGTPYSQTLAATGGIPPYTWSLPANGVLPPGLTLSPAGVISGTPTTLGNYKFNVQVADSEVPPARGTSASLSINIQGNLVISPTSLPQGTVDIAYNTQLTVTGGTFPYTWSYTGTLPPGLTLNSSTGKISGVPTTSGAYPITVTATDSEKPPVMGSASLSITVVPTPPLQVTTTSLPGGTQGSTYIANLMATGGVPPYSWSLINGTTLPPGLVLSPSGAISGNPTAAGTFPITVQVSDTLPADTPATASFSIIIQASAVPVIVTKALPAGLQNIPYQATLEATGGTPPYTWSVLLGHLPNGLGLGGSTGTISGTPTAQGVSNFTVQVTDSQNHISFPSGFSITVSPPITNNSLNGHYTFSFNGYENGTAVLMAGSFVAKGDGTFASGVFDMNSSNGESMQTLLTGAGQSSYAVQGNGLGTMTLVTAQATYNFSVAIFSDGNGQMIQENADPATRGSGVLRVQSLATPGKGNYVFGSFGADATGGRFASAGFFTMDASGNVTNGVQDTNDNGTPANTMFTGTFNAPDQNGRGTATLSVAGTNYNYVYYVVSLNHLVILGSDPVAMAPLSLGSVLVQVNSIGGSGGGNYLLKGTSILELNGVDTSGTPAATVSAGLLTGDGTTDGNGNGNINATFDQNDGGTFSYNVVQGQYNVATNGRTTITSTFGTNPPILYLVNQNLAFVVETDPAVTSGIIEPMSGGTISGSVILGSYLGGTVMPVLPSITDEVDYLLADGSNLSGNGLTSTPGGPGTVNIAATYQVDQTGRTIVTGTPAGIMYVISPEKVVLVPSGSTPCLSVFNLYGSQ